MCLGNGSISNTGNYVRSSSPEYDEVVLTDNSEDEDEQQEEEFSEVIPIKAEPLKSPGSAVSANKNDDGAVVFDDSDDYSLPQVDWSCIDSSPPNGNAGEVMAQDEESDDAARPNWSDESAMHNQSEVMDFATMSSVKDVDQSKDCRVGVSEVDRSTFEGLVFNTSDFDDHMGMDVTASRLSRKRSRVSKDECEEQVQYKRLYHSFSNASVSVAETVLPMQCSAGSDGANLLPSYDHLLLPSSLLSTPVFSSISGVSNILPDDSDACFSQGM